MLLLVATAAFTYPQIATLNSAVGNHYDALFSIWRLGWIAHALQHHAPLFDANIFFPDRLTLAYSDAILLPGFMAAPFILAGVKLPVVYNLLVLATYPATGYAMYWLVEESTGSFIAGIFAAFIFAFSPFRIAHLPQIELLWMWPIPMAFAALHRLTEKPTVPWAICLGVAVVAQVYGGLYYAIFLVLGLAVLAVAQTLGKSVASTTTVAAWIALAAIATAIAAWPYLQVYRAASSLHPARTLAEVATWSADWTAYVSISETSLLYRQVGHLGSIEKSLFPGILAVAAGLWAMTNINRVTAGYAALALIAIDLSLGTHGSGLFVFLFKSTSAFNALRVPARAYVLCSASVSVLAGVGCADLLQRIEQSRSKRIAHAIGVAMVVGISLEFWSAPVRLMPLDTRPPVSYSWLASQPSAVVLEWPVPEAGSLGVTHEPLYMYYSTRHWKPLVNGYSGNYPFGYLALLEVMTAFPSDAAVRALRQHGVTHIVMHRAFDPAEFDRAIDVLRHRVEFERLIYERIPEGDVAIFRLRP